ncbi:WD repeat-containing protein 74 [Phlyctochytrium bullatum]|nr:WD repeat-containing protein 74 [Phlyctochytrium bullatum]
MLAIVGDDVAIRIREQDQKPALKKPRLINTPAAKKPIPAPDAPDAPDAESPDADSKQPAQSQIITPLITKIDRSREVQLLQLCTSDPGLAVAALKNGTVVVLNVRKGEEVISYEAFGEAAATGDEVFVGLHEARGTIITCTSKGTLSYQYVLPGSGGPEEQTPLPTFTTSLGVDKLCRMRVFPGNPVLFATGGDERDLTLWDASECTDDKPTPKQVWKAKNVKNNHLDLRVPVHVLDMQFLEPQKEKPSKVVVVTKFKHVRVYDLEGVAKRPVMTVEIGDYPLKHVAVVPGRFAAIVTDTTGHLFQVDLKTGKKTGSYRGLTGAVTAIEVLAERQQVLVAGLDRFIRAFQLDGEHRMLSKIYVKQRITCLAVNEQFEDEEEEQEAEGEDSGVTGSGDDRRRRKAPGRTKNDENDVEGMLQGLETVA